MSVKEIMERLKEYVFDVEQWEIAARNDGDEKKEAYFRGQAHAYNSALRLLENRED